MGVKFNFNQVKAIYNDAWRRKEPTIAFELRDDPGRFVFMMFFAPEDSEDKEAKDRLYILLGRTQILLKLKMYGSHRNGDFSIFLNEREHQAIRHELNIQGGGPVSFDLATFLQKLNLQIPQNLSLHKTIEVLRNQKEFFQKDPDLGNLVDEASKIYPIGMRQLPPDKHPREKTLRKLYLHVQADSRTIADFIEYLKRANCTFAWTDDPSRANKNVFGGLKITRRPSIERGPRNDQRDPG